MKDTASVNDVIQSVATIVQQQGQHDFPSYNTTNDDTRSAALCGLSVYIRDGRPVRIKARDIDIVLDSRPETANDEPVVNLSSYMQYSFVQGGIIELENWYARLTRFQSVFRLGPDMDPAAENIA